MKKIILWLLALMLTGTLILFSSSFLGRQVIAPAMNEDGAPVSDSVIRAERQLVKERMDRMAELYSMPAEQVTELVDEETLKDLNGQSARWVSSILMTGKPTDEIKWDTDKLEELLYSQPARVDLPSPRVEDVSRSVIRTVLPVRQELIDPGLKKVRERIDLPNVLTFFAGFPWAALALCALLAGLIALLETRNIRHSLQYIGAAAGAAAIVLIALAVLYLCAGIEPMIREASKGMMIHYQDIFSHTAVRAAVLTAVMIACCAVCMILSRRSSETA